MPYPCGCALGSKAVGLSPVTEKLRRSAGSRIATDVLRLGCRSANVRYSCVPASALQQSRAVRLAVNGPGLTR